MLDCISGGRLIAGFPVGTPMDTCYAYGQNPSQLRERYHEAHDLIVKAWREPKPFAWNGRFHAAPLREPLAAAGAEAAPADLDPGRRLGRDLAVVRGARLRLRLPLVLRLPGRPGHDERLLGGDEAARQGPQPVPRRLPPVRRRGRVARRRRSSSTASRPSTSTTAASTSTRATRRRRATRARRRSARKVVSQVLAGGGALQRPRGLRAAALRGDRLEGLRDHRQPGRGGRAAPRGGALAERRTAHAAAPVRQHGPGPHALQHRAVREEGEAAARRISSRTSGRTAGGRSRCPREERARPREIAA